MRAPMSIDDDAQRFPTSPGPQPVEHSLESDGSEPLSFVELVLVASECSEDEGEIRLLVDTLLASDQLSLKDLREDRIPAP